MRKVIILEPDPMVARILKESVSRRPQLKMVACAKNIEQLTRMEETLHPQLILGETKLMDGDLEAWLLDKRQNASAIDFIAVTAEDSPACFMRFQKLGALDYILKPFSDSRIDQALIGYTRRAALLKPDQVLTQERIDAWQSQAIQPILQPKETFRGSERTWEKVMTFIQSCQGDRFTLDQLTKSTGLSRSAAHRYVEDLLVGGQLEVTSEYGQVGRPKLLYRQV